MDNGNNQRRRCHPAKKRAVELAEVIHWDDGKGKREQKERGGGGIGVGGNNNAPGFAIG